MAYNVVDVKPLWMCFIMLLCCVLWQMLLPYALVEDVKPLIRNTKLLRTAFSLELRRPCCKLVKACL